MGMTDAEHAALQAQIAAAPRDTELDADADKLMALIESVYDFDLVDYDPGVILAAADTELNFDWSYVDDLICNLAQRKLYKVQMEGGPHWHPADAYDRWRLIRTRKGRKKFPATSPENLAK